MNAFKTVFTASLLALLVACSGGGDNTPSTTSSSSGGSSSSKRGSSTNEDGTPTEETNPTDTTSSSGSSQSSKPSGATSTTCTTADDCGYWFCDCEDDSGRVTPVNSRNCKNGWCMDAATSCPSACSAFGKKWVGTAGGGPDQK